MSLDERIQALSERLAGAAGASRHELAAELAWAYAERGDLGAAFRVLWEADETPDPSHVREVARAELQAYCGNEDAALGLIGSLPGETPGVALVRAQVAASRGDWETARDWAARAEDAATQSGRRSTIAERAGRALAQDDGSREDTGDAALIGAARLAHEEGASRTEADTWAELCALRRSRGDEEGAQQAAIRAVELWDDMAMTLPPPLRTGFWCDVTRQTTREASKRQKRPASATNGSGLRSLLLNLRRLASERNLEKLLALITDGAVALSGAERGFVLLVDEAGQLEAKTIRGAESQLGKPTAAFSRSIAETVLIDGEPVVTVDATHDARVQDYMSVHQLMLKSIACLPIEARGRVWGVLYLEHRSASGRFSGTDLSVLRAYADQAAIAIETASLIERIDAQRRDLQSANEALREANLQLEEKLQGQEEALQRTRREIERLEGSTARGERWGLVGVSEGMTRVYEVLDRVCANDVPVVITGESGTGKELVARAIHRGSARGRAVRVAQLRGHPRGASRERVVRPRCGRLHRRHASERRRVRPSRRRHVVHGRNRRHAAAHAARPAPRAPRGPCAPGGCG